jgi:molybdate transport system permease protein
MMSEWLEITLRSLGISLTATVFVLLVAIPIAYLLSRREFYGKSLVAAVLMLPLVLPPTAVGALLLALLGRDGPIQPRWLGLGQNFLFTWRAAVLASAVMAFPLALRTARVAFDGVDARLEAMADTLGYSWLRRFGTVTLPLARRGLAAAAILAFLRGLGEFGATVMIAGNIPGQTQTLALAIEARHSAGRVSEALGFAALAMALGITALVFAERLIASQPPSRT